MRNALRHDQAADDAPERDAVETVISRIKDGVRQGHLVPGQKLAEAELTSALGVSRTSLREAFGRLAAEGVVDLQRHRGAFVRRMSRADVEALFQVREMAEGLAARLAAQQIDEKNHRKQMTALVAALRSAVKRRDVSVFVELNGQFHAMIVRIGGNPYLSTLIERMQLPMFRLQFRLLMDHDLIVESQRDHDRIATALLAGDGKGAEAAMQAHVRRAKVLIQNLPDAMFR